MIRSALFASISSTNTLRSVRQSSNFSWIKETFNDIRPIFGMRSFDYKVIRPGEVASPSNVPDHISRPMYATGFPEVAPQFPLIKGEFEIGMIKESCKLARRILDEAKSKIEVGYTTDELDDYLHDLIIQHEAYPSPLAYKGFPKSICTSINNIVCHGIPDDRPLEDGDIISVDISVFYRGFHGDCCATFEVGNVNEKGKYLVKNTEEIVHNCISKCGPGAPFTAIADVIEEECKKRSLNVIPDVTGHGIGQYFHEFPPIIHRYEDEEERAEYEEFFMTPGMIFTIEPAISEGRTSVVILNDGWSVSTWDDSRVAQHEHTILITDHGAEILTTSS